MPRPLWNGSISFGLVNIPIKLFKAQSAQDVRFHQLHSKDGARIQQKRVCPADGEEVAYDQIVKGYEITKDRYVIVDPEELRGLDPKSSQTIDIQEFVEQSRIDPLFYDNGYYVAPDARSQKPYALLAAALEETGKVAVAKFVMRTKEYLCSIRARDGVLILETMYFADEIVPVEDLSLESTDVEITEAEKKMALQLVESLVGEFDIEKYRDEYRDKVIELIEAKADGNEITAPPEQPQQAEVLDLMAALEASLAAAKDKQKKTA